MLSDEELLKIHNDAANSQPLYLRDRDALDQYSLRGLRAVEAAVRAEMQREVQADVYTEIAAEVERSIEKHGDQSHVPLGTADTPLNVTIADMARANTDRSFAEGKGTWVLILEEEVREAFAENPGPSARAELIQVAAVVVKMIDTIDRTPSTPNQTGAEQ